MDDVGDKKTPSIYIVGAQCSGKTTLTMALKERFSSDPSFPPIAALTEAARGVLKRHNFTRNDIREDVERCLELQRLILEAQWTEELKILDESMLVSDRSGIDPIVYAARYAQSAGRKSLLDSLAWHELRNRMSRSLVVVCEPVESWLKDDGVRLMPMDLGEWFDIHRSFCAHLEDADIEFCVLSAEKLGLSDRVEFVADQWQRFVSRRFQLDK
jgi:nicotinamide riboside kinase